MKDKLLELATQLDAEVLVKVSKRQSLYNGNVKAVANALRDLAESVPVPLLQECKATIMSLADQQAMPDDFYVGTLNRIESELSS